MFTIGRASPAAWDNRKIPIAPWRKKESVRWVDGYQRVNELAETRLTYVVKREADIYDLFVVDSSSSLSFTQSRRCSKKRPVRASSPH